MVRTRHLDFYRMNLVCLCCPVFSSFYVGTGENAKELALLIEPKENAPPTGRLFVPAIGFYYMSLKLRFFLFLFFCFTYYVLKFVVGGKCSLAASEA